MWKLYYANWLDVIEAVLANPNVNLDEQIKEVPKHFYNVKRHLDRRCITAKYPHILYCYKPFINGLDFKSEECFRSNFVYGKYDFGYTNFKDLYTQLYLLLKELVITDIALAIMQTMLF